MLKSCIVGLIVGFIALAGCTKNEPSESSASSSASESPQATPAPIGTKNDPPLDVRSTLQPPAASTAEATSSTSSSMLRSLASRLIDSDGRGGWRINEASATELEKLGPDGVGQLWPLLKDGDVNVRRGAAFYLLSEFDPNVTDQVASLTALLGDQDRTVRNIGLSAVKQMRPSDQVAALPRLAAMLRPDHEDKADNRAAIARLCGGLRTNAAEALPALEYAATGDPDAKVRSAALAAIGQVALPDRAAMPLAKGLADGEASVRLVAAARLRQLGPAAAPAVSELAAALADSSSDVADAAAEALIRVGGDATDALVKQLTTSSVPARKLALACLAKIGPSAKSAASAIEKCKQDSDPQVRQLADAALRRINAK
jgi:hypothetical protein